MPLRISIADQDLGELGPLTESLRAAGHCVERQVPGQEGVEHEVVVLQVRAGDPRGLERIAAVRSLPGAPLVLGIVDPADVTSAVQAVHAGAAEVLERPLCTERVLSCLEDLIRRMQVQAAPQVAATPGASALLGQSGLMCTVRELIERVAGAGSSTVLIHGESGVGKELVAREIHLRSARKAQPFLAVNCASLCDHLLEAELFGYAPGAFTGSRPKGQEGLVGAAEGGTLFLDEIAELSLPAQAKILRFLQERCYRRVGDSQERSCNVRILAATNRDLPAQVERGTFREDLFYRLNVFSLEIPALRERLEDIAQIATAKLARLCAENHRPPVELSDEALVALQQHSWPGNVRELENVLARALLASAGGCLSPATLHQAGLGPKATRPEPQEPWLARANLKQAEAELIRRALDAAGGNKSRAARELGIHRATLHQKLRVLGLA